jgi:hypothetical protein
MSIVQDGGAARDAARETGQNPARARDHAAPMSTVTQLRDEPRGGEPFAVVMRERHGTAAIPHARG